MAKMEDLQNLFGGMGAQLQSAQPNSLGALTKLGGFATQCKLSFQI